MNNDLISREALKKALDWVIDNPYVDLDREIMEEIDNAPTVSDRYEEGYAQGYIDGSTGADWKGGAE